MGIRDLYTYNKEKHFYYTIDIKSEFEKYRTKYNKKPIIIIDCSFIETFVYNDKKEKILGGRYHLYNERAENIFKTFIDLGCEIILVSDGQLYAERIPTRLKLNKEKHSKCLVTTSIIDAGLDLNDKKLLSKCYIKNMSSFFTNYRAICKKYGKVIRTIREADQEMVCLANEMNALAIITDDSDFLIFDGNWQYWNARSLKINSHTITVYDKAALRSHLALNSEQMILFATLSGNDFLKYDQVENFHIEIAPFSTKKTFTEIANVVRKIKSSPYNLNKDDENYLVDRIFNANKEVGLHDNREEILKDFQLSIRFFCDTKFESGAQYSDLKFESETLSSELLKTAFEYSFIYAMLVDRPFKFYYHFDLTSDDFTPYYQLIRPFICRAMGIILKHNENEKNLTRKFYAKLSRFEDFTTNIERPIFPPYDLPPLLELLTKPWGDNAELDNLRMKLLCWNISPNSKLTPEIILNLPEEHVFTILVIYVLVEHKQISIEEADCLLFANVADTSVKNSISLDDVNRIDGRTFRIAFLFTRFFQIIGQPIKILGLSRFKSLIVFDGLFYHYLVQNWNKAKFTNDLNKLHEQYKTLRIYAKDFNLIN